MDGAIEPALGRATPIVPVELPPHHETGEPSEDEALEASLSKIDTLTRGLASVMEPELQQWARQERAALGCQDVDARNERIRHGGWPWPKHIHEAPAALMLVARSDDTVLFQGSLTAARWFDEDPAGFSATFSRQHRNVSPTAHFPAGEAALSEGFIARI